MFSNFRYPIILFISGFFFMMIGMSLRIMHWPGGKLLTGSMMMVQGFAVVWLVIIVFKQTRE